MERNEAVIVLQDILCNFSGKFINSIVLGTSSGNPKASGYRIYIKGTIDESSMQKMRDIASMYSLSLEEKEGLVIFGNMQDNK